MSLFYPFRHLYNKISLISFLLFLMDSHFSCQACQSYSQFHRHNFLSQTSSHNFDLFFLINPEFLSMWVPYSRTGHTRPLQAASFTSWGKENKVRLKNPRVLFALVQILLICVFHLNSFVIVTPRNLMLSTFVKNCTRPGFYLVFLSAASCCI